MFEVVTNSNGNYLINEDGHILVIDRDTNSQLWIPQQQIELLEQPDLPETGEASNSEPPDKVLCDSGSEEEEEKSKRWTEAATLLLIDLVDKHDKEFASGMKKNVWAKITKNLNLTSKMKYSPLNVENKWKALKRTYKNLKIKTQRTGSQRKYWEYYRRMDDIMGAKPEITPPVVASSEDGVKLYKPNSSTSSCGHASTSSSDRASTSGSDHASTSGSNHASTLCEVDKMETPKKGSSFFRKRSAPTVNDRHRDKMARQDKFLELFAKLIEKQ